MKHLIFRISITILLLGLSLEAFPEGMHEHHDRTKMRHQNLPEKKDLALSGTLENGIRIVQVKAFKYGFEPDPIVVKFGEKVRLEVASTDITHGLAIKDFGVNVITESGKTTAAEFIADKKGAFHMHCSVYCGPGHGKMHGTLVIAEE